MEHGEKLQEALWKIYPQESFSITVDDPKNGKPTLVRVKNVEFLSGQDDALRRKAVIKACKERKCKILIGSTIADEGLDIPVLDTLILAGGGKTFDGLIINCSKKARHSASFAAHRNSVTVIDFHLERANSLIPHIPKGQSPMGDWS